jgi:hypothetical protein
MSLALIKIFNITFLLACFKYSLNIELICRTCQNKISENQNIFNMKSSRSLNTKYETIYHKENTLTHTFKNPSNYLFSLITFKDAQLICDKNFYKEYTFFPGYAWSSCACSKCGQHHGWLFRRIDNLCNNMQNDCDKIMGFFGLSVENLEMDRKEDKISQSVEL